MFAPFNKLLHLFPIFLEKHKEIGCGSRLLHSAVIKQWQTAVQDSHVYISFSLQAGSQCASNQAVQLMSLLTVVF